LAKDWDGNKNSIYKTLGASNHTEKEREENDYYATEPKAIDVLLSVETFNKNIWEPACGEGHLSKRLVELNHLVYSSDLINRGFDCAVVDFLECNKNPVGGDIITNPPYKFAKEFVEKGIELANNKLALFLKIQFLEGKARKILFEKHPPKYVYVSSSRLLCAKNADFEGMIAGGGSAVAYAWFVWYKGFNGNTTLKWVN
jgi:hypothetical protein